MSVVRFRPGPPSYRKRQPSGWRFSFLLQKPLCSCLLVSISLIPLPLLESQEALIYELPEHLSDMAAFSHAIDLRITNVTGIEWSRADMRRQVGWVHHDGNKHRRALAVP